MGTKFIVLSWLLIFLSFSGYVSAGSSILNSDILASGQWKESSAVEYRQLQISLLSGVPFTSMSAFKYMDSDVALLRVYSRFSGFDVLDQRGCISDGFNLFVPDQAAIKEGSRYSFKSPAGATLIIVNAKDVIECREKFLSGRYFVIRDDFDLENVLTIISVFMGLGKVRCPSGAKKVLVVGEPLEIRGANGRKGGYEAQFTAKTPEGHQFYISAQVNDGIPTINSCRELLDTDTL